MNGEFALRSVEVLPSAEEIDLRDYITPEMYDSLASPATQQRVNIDSGQIINTLFSEGLNLAIDLGKISKDHRSLSVNQRNGQQILIPGLIGLESLDYATPEVTDKLNIVRLYCGLMLAEELTKAKIETDKFFQLGFKKQFALARTRPRSVLDTFSVQDDPHVIERHRRKTISRFASGIVMSTLFNDEDTKVEVTDALVRQYEIALKEDQLNYVTASAIVADEQIPQDNFPAEEQGYTMPLEPQVIATVISGKISRL